MKRFIVFLTIVLLPAAILGGCVKTIKPLDSSIIKDQNIGQAIADSSTVENIEVIETPEPVVPQSTTIKFQEKPKETSAPDKAVEVIAKSDNAVFSEDKEAILKEINKELKELDEALNSISSLEDNENYSLNNVN